MKQFSELNVKLLINNCFECRTNSWELWSESQSTNKNLYALFLTTNKKIMHKTVQYKNILADLAFLGLKNRKLLSIYSIYFLFKEETLVAIAVA